METDDQQTGYLLTRRQVIRLFGDGFIVTISAINPERFHHLPACIVRPEQIKGSFLRMLNLTYRIFV